MISSLIYAMGGMKLVSDLIAFVYPAYMSFKAVESAETTDDTQWLTYWVVFSVFSIVENITAFFVSWIPFYYFIKIGFFMWLYHRECCLVSFRCISAVAEALSSRHAPILSAQRNSAGPGSCTSRWSSEYHGRGGVRCFVDCSY